MPASTKTDETVNFDLVRHAGRFPWGEPETPRAKAMAFTPGQHTLFQGRSGCPAARQACA